MSGAYDCAEVQGAMNRSPDTVEDMLSTLLKGNPDIEGFNLISVGDGLEMVHQ